MSQHSKKRPMTYKAKLAPVASQWKLVYLTALRHASRGRKNKVMTHIISPVSCTPDDSTIESFLDISKNLLDMVRIESCVLEKMGQFTVEGFLTQKMDLLKSFEDQAARIIKTLSSTPHISAEKCYFWKKSGRSNQHLPLIQLTISNRWQVSL